MFILTLAGALGFILVVWLVHRISIKMFINTIHYANSPNTHCGQHIYAINGKWIIQHTTIPENVNCKACKAKLNLGYSKIIK